jgi:adenylosuccinate lyase
MQFSPLTALSPVDGRYHRQTAALSAFFSEYALIRYRVWIEVEYFIALSGESLDGLPSLSEDHAATMRQWVENFTTEEAQAIKDIEKTTNHDVKAVEYWLKERMSLIGLDDRLEFIHFGLTSQDINNTAIPLSLKHAEEQLILPGLRMLVDKLEQLAYDWKDIPMLAHTHGQPASPTRLGKELMVFVERLRNQLEMLEAVPYGAKFGGATGNFNAHAIAYPSCDWVQFGNYFVQQVLGLHRYQHTTQIEHYDYLAALCDNHKRINTILLDLSRDMWSYISMNYFRQQVKAGEVGSSAMPHKVNPIDFENAEGNLGVANALFEHLSAKLPVSRLQRDLTDSTVLRNLGVPFAHSLIAIRSLEKGLSKILVNESAIQNDLEANWAVVAEAIQTILRREGYPQPYEALKALTRTGESINKKTIHKFIDNLLVDERVKAELYDIHPLNYTGIGF